jgi:hypothetical protein
MIAKLFLEPVKEMFDLRREAQECQIVYGDLSKDVPPSLLDPPQLRRLCSHK